MGWISDLEAPNKNFALRWKKYVRKLKWHIKEMKILLKSHFQVVLVIFMIVGRTEQEIDMRDIESLIKLT